MKKGTIEWKLDYNIDTLSTVTDNTALDLLGPELQSFSFGECTGNFAHILSFSVTPLE